jgi:hypothetical protein
MNFRNEEKQTIIRKWFSITVLTAAMVGIPSVGFATDATSVTFEAESGVLGADFAYIGTDPNYITITTNSTASNPGSAARVASYTVTFPSAGTYELYARIRVGSSSYDDDSMFYGNGFGTKSPTLNSDWILANNLADKGFTNSSDVVTGGGTAGWQVWKWINLTQFTSQGGFTVSDVNLTQTFQIGGREDGLDIDKFVFGISTNIFTVEDLDTGGSGSTPSYPDPTEPMTITNSIGDSLVVGANGVYSVTFVSPAWTFTGYLSQGVINRVSSSGTDNIGDYNEISFNYTSTVQHAASIRLYDSTPVVLFSDTLLASSTNERQFPKLAADTTSMKHITYGATAFGVYSFSTLYDYTGSPWMFFAQNYDAFIFSAASNYLVATNNGSGTTSNPFSCGIDGRIGTLPVNFTHQTILVAENGIDWTFKTWGNALQKLVGRTAPANDAVVEINKLSYWTDNGAGYYYSSPPMGPKLITMRDEFASKGVPIGSVQLDSWFYPKGNNSWSDGSSGIYLYQADATQFPEGLAGFHGNIGVPIITHCRWIDTEAPYISPYVGQYTMSGNVIIDPAWWADRMSYLKNGGVTTFEQDWLSYRGETAFNLYDPFTFFDVMAQACEDNGLYMQYCMVQPHHILQGMKYPNLMTVRCSEDDWNTTRWKQFIYDSHYIQHIGIWPWTDVTMTSETRNMLLSTLSAGPVGPGDVAGSVSAVNINRVARPDSVIVKPDVPLRPLDQTYVNDAWNLGMPFVAATYSDFGALRPLYVFAFATTASLGVSITPSELGMNSDAYVYNYFAGTGALVTMGNSYDYNTTTADNTSGGTYHIVAPVGPSGLALIGDVNKFVPLGKKRISQLTDDGTLSATVVFAAGEASVMLLGYSPTSPSAVVSQGSGGLDSYNPTTHLFTASVSPDVTGTAVIHILISITNCQQVQIFDHRMDADLNGDCKIDLSDLVLLVNQWLSTSPEAIAPNYSPDIVVDDNINLADFAAMAEQWLVCNEPGVGSCIVNW